MRLCKLLVSTLLLALLCGCGAKPDSMRVEQADLSAITVGDSRQVMFRAAPDDVTLSADKLSLRIDDSSLLSAEIIDVSGHFAVVSVDALAPGAASLKLVCGDIVSQAYPLTIVSADVPVADAPAADAPAADWSVADAAMSAPPADPSAPAAAAPENQTVYLTPSGKRYHSSASCAGGNAYAVTLDQVGAHTPCKRCCQ